MNFCAVVDLGLLSWAEASALQERLVAARKAGTMGDMLLLCEHPHTLTVGRNGNLRNLLASESVLRQEGVAFHATNRGGDITYHGPGQLVGYPILNLAAIRRDVGWYMRMLEEAMIRASAELGVVAEREPGKTGIWVRAAGRNAADGPAADWPAVAAPEKLAALGVHLSRWVTSHGFAYNVTTGLRYFNLIVPCGIAGRQATSLEKLLGRSLPLADVAARITQHLGDVLHLEMRAMPRVQLMRELEQAERSAQAVSSGPAPLSASKVEASRPAAAALESTTPAVLETLRSNA
jgi:lipoyl(octanoyl) transferase